MAAIQETPTKPAQPGESRPIFDPQVEGGSRVILGFGPEMTRRIADLSARTGYDTGELIDIAIAVFEMSLDAVEQGNAVGIVLGDQQLDTEFVGFHKNDPTI